MMVVTDPLLVLSPVSWWQLAARKRPAGCATAVRKPAQPGPADSCADLLLAGEICVAVYRLYRP